MTTQTAFAPMLYIPPGVTNVDFYRDAFGAEEIFRWCNDDGSIHVIELSIDGALFHLHEENNDKGSFSPREKSKFSIIVGLFVTAPYAVMARALAAGAVEVSPMTYYEYGYTQGDIMDPFGHHWTIQKKN